MNEIETIEQSRVLVNESMSAGVLSDKHIQARVNMIQAAIKNIFKKDVHFGTIPGTPKPTLYKPGAEQLLVMFRIAPSEPKIEDLSTPDSIRYRVTRSGVNQVGGNFLGSGVGECSSDEEKFRWRKPVCDAEWDETDVDRRRTVWKKSANGPYQAKQVRMSPADVANTILKMADKRAMVAMTLVVTGASDAFSQDLEDLSEEVREAVASEAKETPAAPARTSPPAAANSSNGSSPDGDQGGRKISEPQRKRFFAIWKNAGKTDESVKTYLMDLIGSENAADITVDVYEKACSWAASK
jgi:hypothetical protein